MSYINNRLTTTLLLCLFIFAAGAANAQRGDLPVNYYYERGAIVDVIDQIGDDKGPGYYRYPLDQRLKRGTFDIKRFTVYEEGSLVVFEVQMRNYIMTHWPDTRQSEYQGFVANMWDIYIDLDGDEFSGYSEALPGRNVEFLNNMGWEKVLIITPLPEQEVFNILRNRTDEIDFQNRIDDIIYPDHVIVQRDRVVVKVEKDRLPGFGERTGFQVFSMGYQNIVSTNRLLNRDVRAFPTTTDFGGGYDTHGNPNVIDMIVPEGSNQYDLLRDYRSEHFREHLRFARVPFVYARGKAAPPAKSRRPSLDPLMIGTPPSLPPADEFIPVRPPTPQPSSEGFKPMPSVPEGFKPIKSED